MVGGEGEGEGEREREREGERKSGRGGKSWEEMGMVGGEGEGEGERGRGRGRGREKVRQSTVNSIQSCRLQAHSFVAQSGCVQGDADVLFIDGRFLSIQCHLQC